MNRSKKNAVLQRDDLFAVLDRYAKAHGYQLNPHQPTLSREIDGLLDSVEKHSYLVCPCRLSDVTGDIFRDKSISCPCAFHKRELKENGYCKCELFVRPLNNVPTLISTSIHRVEVNTELKEKVLELRFTKPGQTRGEVKVYIPPSYRLVDVSVESGKLARIEEACFEDGVWFGFLVFAEDAVLKVEFCEV